MKHKVIIFDLGGVLFHLNYTLTADAFRALGLSDFDSIYSQAQQKGLFDDFEKGHIHAPEFRNEIRRWLPEGVRDEAIDKAWNAMLLGIPREKIDFLDRIKNEYRIFLLSNTNDIHLETVFRMNQRDHGFKDLSRFMEKQYFSCLLGKRKPDAEIFLQVLDENQLKAEDCFFIDDSIQHIEGARKVGLHAHHLADGHNLMDLFRN